MFAKSEMSMIEIVQVNKHYGAKRVLRDVNLRVGPGEVVVLCGPSGAGKTTLLKTINALEPIDGGSIVVNGHRIGNGADLRALRAQVGMVFQGFNLYPHMTAVQNVALAPLRVRRLSRREAEERARALLARVGLAARADAFPARLSGGEQQRVAIARALAMDPVALLLDEPTSALDPENTGEVLDVIAELAGNGMTMLIVSHELSFARHVADRMALMDEGCVVEVAAPDDFLHRPAHERTQRFLKRFHILNGHGAQ